MNHVIIVAGGKGERMNTKINKIFLPLNDKPILYHSIKPFEECVSIDSIYIVTAEENIIDINDLMKKYGFKKVRKIVEGGEQRQDSVKNGLKAIEDVMEDDIVLIHNAANPFLSIDLIEVVLENTKEHGAAALAYQAKDTIKEVDDDGFVVRK